MRTRVLIAGIAALFLATGAAHARGVTTTCEGKVGFYSLSAYAAITTNYGTPQAKDECIFVTRSRIGRKILKVCPKESLCSIEADIENVSREDEITRIISINRIGTPALDAIAAREKTAREKSRWAAVRPYMKKAEDCVVENRAKITEVTTQQDVLYDGICSQEGHALRNQFIKQFSYWGHYEFMNYRSELLGAVIKKPDDPILPKLPTYDNPNPK